MMKNKRKQKWILFAVVSVLIVSSLFILRNMALRQLMTERKIAAQTTLDTFYEHLSNMFFRLNYAAPLSYICDDEGNMDVQVFDQKAQQLLAEDEHIIYLAYFNGDKLETILPKAEYKEWEGKSLHQFMYSYTLAKVVKTSVVEGPETLLTNDKEVFLFITPIVIEGEYKGEIVSAIDKAYVLSQMKLNIFEDGQYDYEVWKVNELGEHKMVVATSDSAVDFSQAVKLSFALPATWNISIQPQKGWISSAEVLLMDSAFILLGMLILSVFGLSYSYVKQKKELQKTHYMDPDSGLYNYEGFCYFVDQVLLKRKQTDCFILYIRLSGYHELSHRMDRGDIYTYFAQIYKCIQEDFPEDTIAGKLREDIIAVAVFQNKEDKKIMEIVEDFILQLFLKRKINGKKEFINPQASIVVYPTDGANTKELLRYAKERYQQRYK